MTSGEYKRAADLFDQIRELPEAEQAAAIEKACAGDDALREQVLRLISADRQAGDASFLAGGTLYDASRLLVADPASSLPTPGTVIGNYRLGPRIGAGGMGVVYEAEDLRLARRVAVKVLPPQGFGTDQKVRIQRFEREAGRPRC